MGIQFGHPVNRLRREIFVAVAGLGFRLWKGRCRGLSPLFLASQRFLQYLPPLATKNLWRVWNQQSLSCMVMRCGRLIDTSQGCSACAPKPHT